jgi:hypothetical protein
VYLYTVFNTAFLFICCGHMSFESRRIYTMMNKSQQPQDLDLTPPSTSLCAVSYELLKRQVCIKEGNYPRIMYSRYLCISRYLDVYESPSQTEYPHSCLILG